MNAIRILIVVILTISVPGIALGQQASKEVGLQIAEQNGKFVLTVPALHLVMKIPKGGLAKADNPVGGAADSPRYFMFADHDGQLIVSGWFESDDNFPGVKQFWADETTAWKQNDLPEASDVSFEDLSSWKAILYDTIVPGNSHIRAHWVQDGTWIDVHLSITSKESKTERRDRLRKALKAIQVERKQ